MADDGGNADNADANDKKANDHMKYANNAAETVENQAQDMLAGRLFLTTT